MFLRRFLQLSKQSFVPFCCNSLQNQTIFSRLLTPVSRKLTTVSTLQTEVDEKNEKLIKTFEKVKLDSIRDLALKKIFAVVHIAGSQFKIATNDIIMTNNKLEAECGELIRLEKVLAVGGRNFTLVGQPLLKRELVNIEAMVMEKTRGEKKIAFKKKRRKGYKRWKGHRQDLTVLKIKSINIDASNL